MAESAVDLLIHLRQWDDVEQVGQIDADLSDGRYFSGRLRLDLQALQEAAHNHDLEQYGRLLHEALFDGVIGRAYDLAAGLAAGSNGGPLRFRLWVEPTAARLAALKWECLAHYHDTRLVPLSVRADTLFSRYTGLGIAEPQPVSQRPIHLLVAVANPANLEASGLAPINVAAEIQSLRDAVGDLARGGGLKVTFLPGQTGLDEALLADLEAADLDVVSGPTSLEQILRRMREAHIVHLLSHGRFVGAGDNAGPALYLEAEEGERAGQVSPVTDRALVDRLRALDALPHLLFLAACESAKSDAEAAQVGLAPRLVQAGVPAVIAMQERVEIAAARQLAGDFYHEILRHGVVDRALNSARGLLFREQDQQWAVPVLFMRLRTGRLFTADPVRATLDAMAEHPAFRFFSPETSNYIPLPIEAVQVTTDQLAAEMESLSQESVATTEVLKAMVEALERSRVAEGPPDLVMLVGGFGTNKSTQLKNVVWQTIQSSLGTMGQSLIPLYVDLSNYYPDQAALDNPLEAYVLKQLARFWPDLQADRLEKLPENIRLRLLF